MDKSQKATESAGAGNSGEKGEGNEDERGRSADRHHHRHHRHRHHHKGGQNSSVDDELGDKSGDGSRTKKEVKVDDGREKKKKHRRQRRSGSRSKSRTKSSGGGPRSASRERSGSRGRSRSRSSSRSRSRSGMSRSSSGSRSSSKNSRQSSRDKASNRKHGRKKHGNKGHSVKDRPTDWTREELMEKVKKLANFQIDKVTGAGIFECINKRILNDDVELYYEVMRRYNEVQRIAFKKCLISDEGFSQLISGLRLLRHLRFLDFSNNLLTKQTVNTIIMSFGTAARRLESLDLRLNNLSEEDGVSLYRAFSSIGYINGIPISETRTNLNSKSLILTDSSLRQCEMGVLACLLGECKQITSVDLSRNQIDSKGVQYLMECVRNFPQIQSLNLSHNPLTYPEIPSPTLTGIKAIISTCKNRKHICDINLEGVKFIPEHLMNQIITSTMVNRSITPATYNKFEAYVDNLLSSTAPPKRTMPKIEFVGGFDIDFVFCKLNNIPERHVEVKDDEIVITRMKAMRKPSHADR